jgi:hypothetical protein
MTEVQVSGELGASVDEVWKLVSDFGGLLEAMGMPVELSGPEGIGQERKISIGPEPTVERLEQLDNDALRLVYSIQSGPLPVSNYLATMQLSAIDGGRTKLDWSSAFEPAEGFAEADAINIVTSIYSGGIAGLQARFGP